MPMSLADAILQENINQVRQLLQHGEEINQLDEYGFTPLIEAAIVDNINLTQLLLTQGADPNQQDVTGGTALQWAVENNNAALCKLLLAHEANPNAYNFSGQPILVMPLLRHQSALRQQLVQAGADLIFAQDYINTKLLGHLFELVGTATIVDLNNQFVEVNFEGFFLEITLGLVADSLAQFQNHFAARQLRRYSGVAQFIVEIIQRAVQLIKYQQYRVDIRKHQARIDEILNHEPLLIPVGYEGHAITFIKYENMWVKCDRREDSRLYDNVMFYQMSHPERATTSFLKNLIYEKQSSQFINEELDRILGLIPITELKVEAQISGNCSWANVEAAIPALFFLVLMRMKRDVQAIAHYKTLALNFFHRWREWNKDRALQFCIQSFQESGPLRKASKAEILATILFQCCDVNNPTDRERIETILSVMIKSPYQYLLQNYLRIYYYETYTEEGKRFAQLLKDAGYLK
ncbi:MAG: ankyrin repeat domain-containing protein [Gammaproteobacteria bacterium]|nr:ankyrin repeat domain-containing protein [Gammaproteobacteria bacterium]